MGNASTRGPEEKSKDQVKEASLLTWYDKGTSIGQETAEAWFGAVGRVGQLLVWSENCGIATLFVYLILVVI